MKFRGKFFYLSLFILNPLIILLLGSQSFSVQDNKEGVAHQASVVTPVPMTEAQAQELIKKGKNRAPASLATLPESVKQRVSDTAKAHEKDLEDRMPKD